MGEDFKPSLHVLAEKKFDGKVKADYDELTQFLTISLAKDGKASTYKGIVNDQEEVSEIAELLLKVIGYVEPVETEEVEEKPKKKK